MRFFKRKQVRSVENDHVGTGKQRDMSVQAHQSTGGEQSVQYSCHCTLYWADSQFVPLDGQRDVAPDQLLDPVPDSQTGISDDRFDLGIGARRGRGDAGEMRDLMGRIMIEEKHHSHRDAL